MGGHPACNVDPDQGERRGTAESWKNHDTDQETFGL